MEAEMEEEHVLILRENATKITEAREAIERTFRDNGDSGVLSEKHELHAQIFIIFMVREAFLEICADLDEEGMSDAALEYLYKNSIADGQYTGRISMSVLRMGKPVCVLQFIDTYLTRVNDLLSFYVEGKPISNSIVVLDEKNMPFDFDCSGDDVFKMEKRKMLAENLCIDIGILVNNIRKLDANSDEDEKKRLGIQFIALHEELSLLFLAIFEVFFFDDTISGDDPNYKKLEQFRSELGDDQFNFIPFIDTLIDECLTSETLCMCDRLVDFSKRVLLFTQNGEERDSIVGCFSGPFKKVTKPSLEA